MAFFGKTIIQDRQLEEAEGDERSLGEQSSHSFASNASSAEATAVIPPGIEPIIISASLCRAISTHVATSQEIVCAAGGDCKKSGHPKKRVEGRRAPPGGFIPLLSSKKRLIGGILSSFMSEAEADAVRIAQLEADRESAALLAQRATPGKLGNTKAAASKSPDSFSSYEEVVGTGGPPVSSIRKVGTVLQKEEAPAENKLKALPVKGEKCRSTSPLTNLLRNTPRFPVGSKVWYTPARGSLGVFEVFAVEQEPSDGSFLYTVTGVDGRQYDTLETRLENWQPPAPAEPVGFQAMQAEFRKREAYQAQQMAMLQEQLAKLTTELSKQKQTQSTTSTEPATATSPAAVYYAVAKGRSPSSQAVYSSLREAQAEVHGVSGAEWKQVTSIDAGWRYIQEWIYRNQAPPTSPGPSGNKWYAVASGKDAESTGVYSSWAAAQVEVHGVAGACYARFSNQEAAQRFLIEHLRQKEQQQQRQAGQPPVASPAVTVPSTPLVPEPVPPHSGVPVVNEAAASRTATGAEAIHPESLNWLGGRTSEPDKAEEGKVFGINFKLTEGQLRDKLVPDSKHLSTASAQHLLEQFLDFCAQPSTVDTVMNENADNNAILSRALSSLAGTANDLTLGGAPADHNWRTPRRITFSDLKNRAMVEERLKDLQDGQYLVHSTTKHNLASVLVMAGYDPIIAMEWTSQSYLYQMSVQGLEYYIRLHQRILTLTLNDNGNFDQAKLEIEHHSKALRSIRTTYGTRVQVLAASYAYLRDQVAKSFRSVKLQEHVQRAQTKLLTKQGELIQSLEAKLLRLESNQGGGGGGGGGAGRDQRCFQCGSQGLHPGSKNECPWKDLPKAEARAKAKEAWEAKRRDGGNS